MVSSTSSSSSSRVKVNADAPQEQVFINFRGVELRTNFVSHLDKGLKRNAINAFIDSDEEMGQELNFLFKRIEGSRIALVIFSPRYTESEWCLKELAKIKERSEQSKLEVIPIFYKVEPAVVKDLRGPFGDKFKTMVSFIDKTTKKKWKESLKYVALLKGFVVDEKSDEDQLITKVVKEVKQKLKKVSQDSPNPYNDDGLSLQRHQKSYESSWGIKDRLHQLEEKLSIRSLDITRIVGVVGMPGIGKTTLTRKLYDVWKNIFSRHVLITDIHAISKELGLNYLLKLLLENLMNVQDLNIETLEAAHQAYKNQLLQTEVLVVLDNVSNKEQIDALLGRGDWIKQGSKIVIATSDKSLIQSLVDDIYEVPRLCDRDALQHFIHYAFDNQADNALRLRNFSKLSKGFVRYTKGNPLALKILGAELLGKDETHWDEKLSSLDQQLKSPRGVRLQNISKMLHNIWKGSYDGLSQLQKDTLLDIACFKSLNENDIRDLLDSDDLKNEIESLVNKFMVNINAGKVEMHETLYMLSKELGQEASCADGKGRHRLWHHQTITDVLEKNKGASSVRSLLLDLSDITRQMRFLGHAFAKMNHLRYLKIYSTHCPQDCDRDIKFIFPEGFQLPLNELRCLHWLKFPLKNVSQGFNPVKLVDLKLPYSEIEQVWEDNKDAPKLKWVDLNHSTKLNTLAGLGKAPKLQELNLEGCTALKKLHVDMKNMKCLVFLNLRGCTSLKSLPEIQLISLKTLILSDCSKFKKFQVNSTNLEVLYLDGTAIKELFLDIQFFQKLVLLSMKGCKKLKRLPKTLGKLTALEQLTFSGCSKLKTFPEIEENTSSLQILLLDETAIEEIPKICSVRRLCLSRNETIIQLPDLINLCPRLQWLDLKYCKKLIHVPQLPPNLQCLDVRGCSSLKSIVKPLICSMPVKNINSTFIFANCNKLEQSAKEEIAAYAERKCQLLSTVLKRCDESCVPDMLFCTSFPGCEIPSWFCHEGVGSMVEFELPARWNHNRHSGIALCLVVSIQNCQSHANLTAKFSCGQKVGGGSCTSITWKVGSLIEQDNKVDTVESDHVFIGYSNCFDFKKLLEGQDPSKCAPTKASLEFGTDGEAKFEVLKSGFSFVSNPEENNILFPRKEKVKSYTSLNKTLGANGDRIRKSQWQTYSPT